MARKPQVRYFDSRKAFYCQVNGKQHCLFKCEVDDSPNGPNRLAANAVYARLITTGSTEERPQEGDGLRLGEVVNFYIAHLEATGTAHQLKRYLANVSPFVESSGDLTMDEMKPYHVQSFLAEMSSRWNDNTKNLALSQINRTINFAVKQGRIEKNPIRTVEKPRTTARGEEYYLSQGFREVLVANGKDDFGRILGILYTTGARPVEIEQVEAHNYDAEHKAIVYRWNATRGYLWKNAKKQKRNRTIYLTAEQAELVESRIKERPTGKLFLNRYGNPYTPIKRAEKWQYLLVRKPVAAYMAKNGIDGKHVIPYSLRHSFITDWLKDGRSIKVCADLCGTSVAEIEKTYSHLTIDSAAMRKMFLAFHEK